MKKTLNSLALIQIVVIMGCTMENVIVLGKKIEMNKGDIVRIEHTRITIEFIEAGTEHHIDDRVIDNAKFIFRKDGISETIFLESNDIEHGSYNYDRYKLTLVRSDGYHQKCAVLINEK